MKLKDDVRLQSEGTPQNEIITYNLETHIVNNH